MNKELIFLCLSITILSLSIISIFTAPIINKIFEDFSRWGKINCQFFSDKDETLEDLDQIDTINKIKNLCYRQKAMYNLEYASLIIDIILGFINAKLALLVYFKISNSINKLSRIFGILSGIICFILTLVYACFSGYIFTRDTAYKAIDPDRENYGYEGINNDPIEKLFSNGAILKVERDNAGNVLRKIKAYEGDKSYEAEYIKYKDLGKKQYNYDKKYYEISSNNECQNEIDTDPMYDGGKKCNYIYSDAETNISNKYLYNNWVTTLILCCLIIVLNIGLIIFGFLLLQKEDDSILLIPNK